MRCFHRLLFSESLSGFLYSLCLPSCLLFHIYLALLAFFPKVSNWHTLNMNSSSLMSWSMISEKHGRKSRKRCSRIKFYSSGLLPDRCPWPDCQFKKACDTSQMVPYKGLFKLEQQLLPCLVLKTILSYQLQSIIPALYKYFQTVFTFGNSCLYWSLKTTNLNEPSVSRQDLNQDMHFSVHYP